MKKKKQKKRMEKKEIAIIIFEIIVTLAMLMTTSREISEYSVIRNNALEKVIGFDNLTYHEQSEMRGIYSDIKPIYLSKIKKVTITHNQTYVDSEENDTLGVYFLGDIKILYLNKTEYKDRWNIYMRILLCHEVIHSLVVAEHDLEEDIVTDIANNLLCYENG